MYCNIHCYTHPSCLLKIYCNIHCNTLQYTATHCNTHTNATHCNTHCSTHCSTLQRTATHCNTHTNVARGTTLSLCCGLQYTLHHTLWHAPSNVPRTVIHTRWPVIHTTTHTLTRSFKRCAWVQRVSATHGHAQQHTATVMIHSCADTWAIRMKQPVSNSLTCDATHLLFYSLTHSTTHPLTHPSIHLLTHSVAYLLKYVMWDPHLQIQGGVES